MITRTLDKKHKSTVPSTKDEVTIRMYYDTGKGIEESHSSIDKFKAMTGLTIEQIKGIKDVKLYLSVLQSFQLMVADVDIDKTKPGDTIQVGDFLFKIPQDVATKRVDLFEFCSYLLRANQQVLEENRLLEIIEIYVQILAHYTQAGMTNYDDYDPEQAHYLIDKVWGCKAEDVFGFGNFFFKSYAELLTGTDNDSSTFPSRLRKLIQDLLRWLKIGGS